jgi:hypothetical protein
MRPALVLRTVHSHSNDAVANPETGSTEGWHSVRVRETRGHAHGMPGVLWKCASVLLAPSRSALWRSMSAS